MVANAAQALGMEVIGLTLLFLFRQHGAFFIGKKPII